jgi:hypothetical protein
VERFVLGYGFHLHGVDDDGPVGDGIVRSGDLGAVGGEGWFGCGCGHVECGWCRLWFVVFGERRSRHLGDAHGDAR